VFIVILPFEFIALISINEFDAALKLPANFYLNLINLKIDATKNLPNNYFERFFY